MQRAELIAHCESVYESYDPNKTTIDSHAEEYILQHNVCKIK